MSNNLDINKKKSTTVLTDIRNFSQTFKDFQGNNSSNFLDFIERYYVTQNLLARTISNNVHMSSTGDGILAIFLDDKDHYKRGYAYILATHRMLTTMCKEFVTQNPGTNISFGMGADSGNVWNVGEGYLNTYVGTVVNRASRIEEITKLFASTTTSIGNSLYKHLVKEFYPSAHGLMEEHSDYDYLLNTNPETILISKQFMLQYIFDMQLKGIQANASIFRMSESLVNDDKLYWSVMNKLVGENQANKIKKIIE